MALTIGIAGPAGAGKDTFARYLGQCLWAAGLTAHIDSYAAPIRDIATELGFSTHRWDKERDEVLYFTDYPAEFQEATKIAELSDVTAAEVYARFFEALDRAGIQHSDTFLKCSRRAFSQVLGTVGRDTDPDLWVTLLQARRTDEDAVVIIPDVRMPNEIPEFLIYIDREGIPAVRDHHTESHHSLLQREADIIFWNDGPLSNLNCRAQEAASDYFQFLLGGRA